MDYIDEAIARLEAEGAKDQEMTEAPPKKTPFEEYAPVVGSMAGGLVLGATTKNPSMLIQAGRSALGTGLGTYLGTSLSQMSRQLGGEEISIGQMAEEQAKNIGKEVALDVVGSGVGAGLMKGVSQIWPKAAPDPLLVKAQQELQKKGTTLSVGQAAPNTWRSTLEGATYQTIGGKIQLNNLYNKQDVALKQMREELTPIAHSIPISRVGSTIRDSLRGGFSALSDMVKPAYEDISLRAASKDVFVDTLPMQKEAKNILDQQTRLGNVGLTEQGGTILQRVVRGDNTLSFSDAQQLRSDLLSRSRMLEEGDPAKRNLTTLVEQVTKEMELGAKQAGSDVYADLMKVNAFYRKSQQKMGDEFVAKLVDKRPSQIVDTIVSAGNESEISALKVALKRAEGLGGGVKYDETWGKVQQHYIDSLLNKASVINKEGETIGHNLLKDFTDPKTSRTMKKVLTKEQMENIKTFAETSLITQRKPKSQNSWIIPMIQAGAIVDVLTFKMLSPGADAAIAFSPLALGKMLTNPERASRLLGIIKRPGVPASPALLAKVAGDIEWANKEAEKEKKSMEEDEYKDLLGEFK